MTADTGGMTGENNIFQQVRCFILLPFRRKKVPKPKGKALENKGSCSRDLSEASVNSFYDYSKQPC